MFRQLIYIILFAGTVFIVIGYAASKRTCPPPVIEYRYIPRTFTEEQENPVSLEDIYAKMFRENSPQPGGYVDIYIPKNEVTHTNFVDAKAI